MQAKSAPASTSFKAAGADSKVARVALPKKVASPANGPADRGMLVVPSSTNGMRSNLFLSGCGCCPSPVACSRQSGMRRVGASPLISRAVATNVPLWDRLFGTTDAPKPPAVTIDPTPEERVSLAQRHAQVLKHFPSAMGVDDLMGRVEMALAAYGFRGDNTIAMSNLCRDESCMILEDKIEAVFGSCFSTHGLGGVLTCGVIGMKAGLSHSPVEDGKERYVFFSFPHIAIDSNGNVGSISRPNRPGASSACGALIKTMMDLQAEGTESGITNVGRHDPQEPEFSILKNRIARMIKLEDRDPSKMDLVDFTKAAERVITADLEYLISQAVDTSKADYAVITGVQVHNWAYDLDDSRVPSMEFVAPSSVYTVVNNERVELDLQKVPALSPRQMQLVAAASGTPAPVSGAAATELSTLQEIPRDYLMKRLGGSVNSTDSSYVSATYEKK